jgi:hypothetical protein
LTLSIDDAVRTSLTNLALEKKLNDLFEAGDEAMRLSRRELWESFQDFGGPYAWLCLAGAISVRLKYVGFACRNCTACY